MSAHNHKGFTLVELMVVVAIIGILAVIGVTVFSNTQKGARDGRRRADINAIAKALEANKTPGAATYNILAVGQFAGGSIPTDSANGSSVYCAATVVAVGAPPTAPAGGANWPNTAACPTAPAGYTVISASNPPATAGSWTVCASLETSPATPFCRSSAM